MWKIHDVILIAHLEPATSNNPYQRPHPDHPPAVTVDGATTDDHYEIEQLLHKQVQRCGHSISTEYLIRWKGYGPEHDIWYNVKDLGDAKKAIQDYETHLATEQEAVLP